MSTPIKATALDGTVCIRVDATTARDLAEAWATVYAAGDLREATRPDWAHDVVTLVTAAAQADQQTGDVDEPVQVPLLRVIGGELR